LCFGAIANDQLGDSIGTCNVGIAAGFSTGYGLSYRHWFRPLGVQITGVPYYSKISERERRIRISCGATALYLAKETRHMNLILYAGPHFWYNEVRELYSSGELYLERDGWLYAGLGPGLDFHFWDVSLSLMLGFAFRSNFEGTTGLFPTAETGVFYSW
jgi:hypothetical protein